MLADELGAGGMASVWRAEDTLLRREVAVKLPYPHLLRQPELRARFLREARAAAALDHPGILRIFDIGADDPPFIVMELLRGRTLKAFLEDSGAPLGEMVALIGAALAAAVAVAHAAGIVHRDLKPANIMVEAGGRLVICDFGLARVDDDALATQSGELLGTPAFMPPEQALGRRVDARGDIYSLGATLYQLATGTPPYKGTAAAVVQQVIRGDLEAPQRRNPAIGNDLAAVLVRAMARAPAERYATAAELGAALDEIASGFPDRGAELAAYFADPGAWNRRATPKILEATYGRARAAAGAGKVARALALAERVLAIDPAHAEANSLVARLGVGARRKREATLLVGAVGIVAAAGLGVVFLRGAPAAPDAAPADAAAVAVPDAALAPVVAPAPDAAPAPSPPDAPPRRRRPPVPPPAPAPTPLAAPDAALAPTPAAPPPPAPATVSVKIVPWCDIAIDSIPHGRSPAAPPIALAPGHHTLVCAQPGVGAAVTVELDLAPGERRTVEKQLYDRVAVRIGIARGAVRVDGRAVAAGATLDLSPGPHEVEVQGDPHLGPTYIHIPTRPCELRETPELSCYEAK